MTTKDYSHRYCIVGAGAAGLSAAKNLKQAGIAFDVIEREDDLGGNWNYGSATSSIYKSVHTISSKEFSRYLDYPMAPELPTYLRWEQALAYLKGYADHFRLREQIEFARSVLDAAPHEAGWLVTLDGDEQRHYRGLIVANGHLCKPNLPDYAGHFNGTQVHSGSYKTPDLLAGKRVLVVGAGNSGCDIAVEAVHHAASVMHSTRRGYYYWPKFVWGLPVDQWAEVWLKLRTPLWGRRLFGGLFLRMATAGQPETYGLPKPDHKMFESHFIINSTLFYHLGHGDIQPKPDVRELRGDTVLFSDGSEEPVDVIIYATGFHLDFPFLEQRHLSWPKTRPELFMNMFDRQHENLFFIGLFQTSTGNWPIMDHQSRLLASYLQALDAEPEKARWLQERVWADRMDASGGIRFDATTRHVIEVEHFSYRAGLQKLIKAMRPSTMKPAAAHRPALAVQAS
jgi:cation diffusion facilitator CzcD-associated flavoprotein CzcO